MAIFFAASTGGFYDSEIHGTATPRDAVAITAEAHRDLLAGQAQGQVVAVDPHGKPALANRPLPSAAAQMAALRQRRDHLLAASDFTQMPDYPLVPAQRAAWLHYRQSLRDLPATAKDMSAIKWPTAPQ